MYRNIYNATLRTVKILYVIYNYYFIFMKCMLFEQFYIYDKIYNNKK